MQLSLNSLAKVGLNAAVAPFGLQVTRRASHDWSDTRNFIPLQETLDAAESAGLSVGDYVDGVMNKIPGATQATIDGLAGLGIFSRTLATVVEIGPGTGRYLEKTIVMGSPRRYEIYETSQAWASYVAEKFAVICQPTDGKTLSWTADASADLVHAHKVFSTIPFIATCAYWTEMARVAKPGGYVVFDVMTESCLDAETLRHWAASGVDNGSYPAAMPRQVAIDYFDDQSFEFVGSFLVPMGSGRTEVLAFRKRT